MKLRKRSKLEAYNNWGYAFVAPFVIVFSIFNIYPVLRTLYLSFTDMRTYGQTEPVHFVAFSNYVRAASDKIFWNALRNTVRIWGVNIVLQLGLAFLLMIIFSDLRMRIKGLSVFRIVYYLPNLMMASAIALLFQQLLDKKYGSFNYMIFDFWKFIITSFKLGPKDVPQSVFKMMTSQENWMEWLNNPRVTPYTISVIQTWLWFGNSFLMLMAAVQGISKDYFEAAAIDGAGNGKIFTHITLPLIRPIMMYVAITSLIGGLQMFDIPQLIVTPTMKSYPEVQTVIMYMYRFAFTPSMTQTGFASAVAYLLFIIIFAISIIQFYFFNRED